MLITDLAIKNRTTIFVLMVMIILSGVLSYITLPREAAPEVKVPLIVITTANGLISPPTTVPLIIERSGDAVRTSIIDAFVVDDVREFVRTIVILGCTVDEVTGAVASSEPTHRTYSGRDDGPILKGGVQQDLTITAGQTARATLHYTMTMNARLLVPSTLVALSLVFVACASKSPVVESYEEDETITATSDEAQYLSEGAELAQRREKMDASGKLAWRPREMRQRKVSTALKAYAALTTSADRGAVRDLSQIGE